MQYIIFVLIFIFIILIIGEINFNLEIKRKLFLVSSICYNAFFGYYDILIFKVIYLYFSNTPKNLLGPNSMPELDFLFNMLIAICASLIYLTCLIPINKYMSDKGKINFKLFIEVNVIATLTGIILSILI